MRIFRRPSGEAAQLASGPEARAAALVHWQALAAADDPVLADGGKHLAEAIRSGQVAAAAGEPDAWTLLAASYLVAASLPTSSTTPSDPILRFAGLAAVVIGRSGGEGGQPTEIADWFRRIRGRLRGSVFVPRDVEYAFSGMYQGLEGLATDPSKFSKVRALLEQAVLDSRLEAARKLVDSDPRYRTRPASERAARAREVLDQVPRLAWRDEDREAIRKILIH